MAKNVVISREDAANIYKLYDDVKKCERMLERNQSGSFMTIVLKSANDENVMRAFELMKARITPEVDKPETPEPAGE